MHFLLSLLLINLEESVKNTSASRSLFFSEDERSWTLTCSSSTWRPRECFCCVNSSISLLWTTTQRRRGWGWEWHILHFTDLTKDLSWAQQRSVGQRRKTSAHAVDQKNQYLQFCRATQWSIFFKKQMKFLKFLKAHSNKKAVFNMFLWIFSHDGGQVWRK